MGFLAFLQRRQGDKPPLFNSPSTVTLSHQRSNNSTTVTKLRRRSDADLLKRKNVLTQQHASQDREASETTPDDYAQAEESCATPAITVMKSPSIAESQQSWQSESRPFTAPYGAMGMAYNTPNEPIPFSNSAKRRLSNSSSYSDLLQSRRSSVASSSAVSAACRHVDLLDAHGQLGPSDFKARIKASGSREYGEDVAERNIGQNGLLLGSPAVQKFYATRASQVVLRRQNTSQSKFRKYSNTDVILEHPEIEDAYPRPSSRASSIFTAKSMPTPRVRATSLFESTGFLEPQYTGRASIASIASSHATVSSIGQPKLETSKARSEMEAEESDDTCPPSIPRYRRNERDSSLERPSSALGSVRRARQSMDAMSAYNVTEYIKEESEEELFNDDAVYKRLSAQHQRASHAIQSQTLSIENMLRWRQSFGEVDEDQRSTLTERAADSRDSRRQWSITSTEPTEQSDVSSVNFRPLSRATATTSVDIPSIMDPDEKNSCKTRPSYDIERSQQGDDDDACSITTDGSNIDAFMEKRKRRAAAEDSALVFNESGFFSGGGALPGLFDLFQVLPAPIAEEPAKEELASLRPMTWQDNVSFSDFMGRAFPMQRGSMDTREDPGERLISPQGSRWPKLTAKRLKKLAGLELVATDNIQNHLRLDLKYKTVDIYHYTSVLKENLLSSAHCDSHDDIGRGISEGNMPRDLALETLATLQEILFPLDADSQTLLQSLVSKQSFDPDCLRLDTRPYRRPEEKTVQYRYWGARLADLHEQMEAPTPNGYFEKWMERRSGARYVMMATLGGVVIAVVLGALSLAVSIFQAWVGYQQWQHPINPS
ncbi:hypothetical protein NLG97_g2867 [Lecanicillium saksenae]|uniref:Uncharacterized protein n=1 Tax=Lecanicillium saksenae TaxID=468837 RepID=A0ACC1QZM6_9HYPO|nr:hypothetical protein NLG97_g2867 [Lecanicillium saksenae]